MWRLVALLLAAALTGQTTVPVTAVWDLDADHDTVTSWELEADSVVLPCGNLQVLATERRCTADVPQSASLFRLRGIRDNEVGAWSGYASQSWGPGPFSITFAGELPVEDPVMAFPQVATVNGGGANGTGTSHACNLPASIASGDLLLAFFESKGSHTWSAGWTRFTITDSGNASNAISAGWRIATADANDDLTVTTSVGAGSAHTIYRITGHDSGQAPEATQPSEVQTANPNPPTLTPTGGAKDYLWFVVSFHISEVGVTTYPTTPDTFANGRHDANTDAGAARFNVASARLESNATSLDPGTFTLDGTPGAANLVMTFVVHPGAGGGGGAVAKAYQFLSFGVH